MLSHVSLSCDILICIIIHSGATYMCNQVLHYFKGSITVLGHRMY